MLHRRAGTFTGSLEDVNDNHEPVVINGKRGSAVLTVFTGQARKDAKRLQAAGLRPKAELLLRILR